MTCIGQVGAEAVERGPQALETADQTTSYIGIAVMNADAHAGAVAAATQMRQALESRKTIDMALGILIATHHCSPEQAFAHCRRHHRPTTASCASWLPTSSSRSRFGGSPSR